MIFSLREADAIYNEILKMSNQLLAYRNEGLHNNSKLVSECLLLVSKQMIELGRKIVKGEDVSIPLKKLLEDLYLIQGMMMKINRFQWYQDVTDYLFELKPSASLEVSHT